MQGHTAAVREPGRGAADAAPGTLDELGPAALVDLTSVLTAWAPTAANDLRSPLMAAFFSSACASMYEATVCAMDGGACVHCHGKPGLGGAPLAAVAGQAHARPTGTLGCPAEQGTGRSGAAPLKALHAAGGAQQHRQAEPMPGARQQHRQQPTLGPHQQQEQHQAAPAHAAACFSRPMTCEMTLRVLNIPKPMHLTLGLADAYPYVKGRRSNRCTIHIRSPDGTRHPVTMTQVPGTPYRRFTAGWRSFCYYAGLRIGDTVHFRRTGGLGELEACVTRGGARR